MKKKKIHIIDFDVYGCEDEHGRPQDCVDSLRAQGLREAIC